MLNGCFFLRLSIISALSYEASAFSASFTNALKDTKTTDENAIVLQKPNIGHCLATCNFVEGGCQSISWHGDDKICQIVKNDGTENDGDNELTGFASGWVYYRKNEQPTDFDQTFMKSEDVLIDKEVSSKPSYTPWNWLFSFDVKMAGADENDQRTGEIIRVTDKGDINSIVLSVEKKTHNQLTVTFKRDGTQHHKLIYVQNHDSIILNFTRSRDTDNQQSLEIKTSPNNLWFSGSNPISTFNDTNLDDREIKVFYAKEFASNIQTISSVPSYTPEQAIEVCYDECRKTCATDIHPTNGCNQMFHCPHTCKMRELGRSVTECKASCQRTPSSGCSVSYLTINFNLCGACNRAECPTLGPAISECEKGCESYPM
ncbi:uncharacterized protein [Clytia hemisphaerica]|uniref:Apple domain-containing protein n=1 Tax=Clytia hemisphaerica TaxID=252671 RepID=A0A7M6DPD2_9CNID